MKNCLDCLFCKINGIKKFLHCSQRNWEYNSTGHPRTIKLNPREIPYYDIEPRKKFNTAIHCHNFYSIDEEPLDNLWKIV